MAFRRHQVGLIGMAVIATVAAAVFILPSMAKTDGGMTWSWTSNSSSGPRFALRPALSPLGSAWGDSLNTYAGSQVTTNRSGQLVITARRVNGSWVSGHVSTKGRTEFTYGYVQARIRTPDDQGMWPAFWMLGAHNRWPGNGPEIDVMEKVDDGHLYGSLHTWGKGARPATLFQVVHRTPSVSDGQFHTYAVNWAPGTIEWYRDGVKYGQSTRAATPAGRWSFDQPHYLILDLAVGGAWPGPPGATTPSTASMTVDWVKVSRPKPVSP